MFSPLVYTTDNFAVVLPYTRFRGTLYIPIRDVTMLILKMGSLLTITTLKNKKVVVSSTTTELLIAVFGSVLAWSLDRAIIFRKSEFWLID